MSDLAEVFSRSRPTVYRTLQRTLRPFRLSRLQRPDPIQIKELRVRPVYRLRQA